MNSNQEQHYYQTPGHLIAAGIALSLLDIIAVSLRFWVRRERKGLPRGNKRLMADDWLLLPATILTTGMGILLVYGVFQEAIAYRHYPSPRDNPSSEALDQMTTSMRLVWAICMMTPVAMACTKMSFLLFYKRHFDILPKVKVGLVWLIRFIALWGIAFLLATFLCCMAMRYKMWDRYAQIAMCPVFLQVLMAFCITGFVTDVVIIIIPIPLIYRRNLSTGKKACVCATFLLGAVTIAASLARLIVSVDYVKEASNPDQDFILNETLYCYWGMVEWSTAVLAACLPSLAGFFKQRLRQPDASKTQSTTNSDLRSYRMFDVDHEGKISSTSKPSSDVPSNLSVV